MRRLLVLLTLTIAVAACGGDDGGTGPAVDESAGAMTRALSLVPGGDEYGDSVVVNDYATAGEALGLERPEPGETASEEEVADWFIPLTTGREEEGVVGDLLTSQFFQNTLIEDEAWRDEVGWAPIDVDLAVEVGPNDDQSGYFAFVGTFDPDGIEDAVTDEDNVWADELEQDGDVYVWGDDPEEIDPERITAVRPLGRGGSMAVLDETTILWAWDPEVLEAGIAAATGDADSLADDEELGPLAEALDDAGVVGGLFSTQDDEAFVQPDFGGDVPEVDVDGPVLEPYEAFATGNRLDDGEPQLVIALLHEDADGAEANAEAIEDVVDDGESAVNRIPWDEQLSLDEVEVDGEVTTISFDESPLNFWARFVFTRDSLLAT